MCNQFLVGLVLNPLELNDGIVPGSAWYVGVSVVK